MADHDVSYSVAHVSYVVAVVCGALALAAAGWLLVSVSHGPSSGQVRVSGSDPERSRPFVTHHRVHSPLQRCIDATASRGVPGCPASSSARSASPQLSDRHLRRPARLSTREVKTRVAPAPAPSTPQSPPSSNPQPATTQSSTPSVPTSTPRRLPHNGPVPGGNTGPPHTGPRP